MVEEIGASIGCGAYLSSLQRTHVANCDLSCAVNFQDLAAADREKLKGFLQNADIFLDSLKSVTLSKEDGEKICNGQGITLPNWKKNAETVRVYGPRNYFLGIGTVSINGYF